MTLICLIPFEVSFASGSAKSGYDAGFRSDDACLDPLVRELMMFGVMGLSGYRSRLMIAKGDVGMP